MPRPSLTRIGPAEVARVIVVVVVLAGCLSAAFARWAAAAALARWGRRLGTRRLGTRRLGTRRLGTRTEALADGTVNAFAHLGPTFVKLGQLIASSPGLFPDALSTAALRCLHDMPPFPAALVRRRVERDLGAPIELLFRSFDDVPLAAASIAQVHACVLPDGRDAVVKVRRPRIARRMVTDLRIMYLLARILDRRVELARLSSLVEVIERLFETTCRELNFAREAYQQERFAGSLGAFGDNEGVTVPTVYWSHCGPATICMQRLRGTPLSELAGGPDTELAVRRGVKAWLEAAVVHGPFHGDVHAGNLWLLDDGRLAYLDFGIMGELGPQWRELLKDMLYTVMVDRDFGRIARGLRRCGVLDPAVGGDAQIGWVLAAMFNPVLDSPISRMDSRSITDMLLGLARQYAGTAPPELALFAKQLLYFERYSAALAPDWVLAKDEFVVRNLFPTD